MMYEAYSLEAHIKVATRNAVIVLPLAFVLGTLSGWALSQWESARIGALIGFAVGLGFLVWLCRMYYVTRGLLHTTDVHRPSGGSS